MEEVCPRGMEREGGHNLGVAIVPGSKGMEVISFQEAGLVFCGHRIDTRS